MKLRISGTEQECERFVSMLTDKTPWLDVQEVSSWYANRGNSKLGRVYVEVSFSHSSGSISFDDILTFFCV